MHDVMNPPKHLVVSQTDTLVIMTGPDGRTVHLSADNNKFKDVQELRIAIQTGDGKQSRTIVHVYDLDVQ
jgi:hypothetical protein